jgi:hypothetical protein
MTAATQWRITAEGFGHQADRVIEGRVQGDEQPTELDAARVMVIEAQKVQVLVPAGRPGASPIDRLRDYKFKISRIEPA